MSDDVVPVDGIRVGPGQFLLAAEMVELGLVFVIDGDRFEVVGQPVDVGAGRYLATVQGSAGQLTAQLQVGRRVG
jgi:hypothetical protein